MSANSGRRAFLLTPLILAVVAVVLTVALTTSSRSGSRHQAVELKSAARTPRSVRTHPEATELVASSRALPTSPVPILGYQAESSPIGLIAEDARDLTSIGTDGTTLTPNGHGVNPTDDQALAQLNAARAAGLPATLLVSNYSDAINNFSERVAYRMLSDPRAIAANAHTLAAMANSQHWQGITVDLESLTHRDETGLTNFVRALRTDLPSSDTVDVDIMNSTSAAQYPATGYDLAALGRAATDLVLMGYDDHGPWENTPGPIGPLGWQRAGLAILLKQVPADKVILGIAGYGYAWEPHANIQLSDQKARQMVAAAGVSPHFNGAAGEWTATLPNGSVIWWSDARSLQLRVTLAEKLHLAGLAVWDLQLSDPIS